MNTCLAKEHNAYMLKQHKETYRKLGELEGKANSPCLSYIKLCFQ